MSNNATADKNNTRPNLSCPICPENKCLHEIEIEDKSGKITYFLNDKEKIDDIDNKRLSNVLLSFPAQGARGKLDISYFVKGECEGEDDGSDSEANDPKEPAEDCVSTYLIEFSKHVDTKLSRIDAEYERYYNLLLEEELRSSLATYEITTGAKDSFNKEYDDDKRILISLDEDNKITYFIKEEDKEKDKSKTKDSNSNIVSDTIRQFLRGFDFLLFGKISYFPANAYRIGVITCNGKALNQCTDHYTDLFLLPKYKVILEGALSFSGVTASGDAGGKVVNEEESAELKIEYKDEIDDEEGVEFSYSLSSLRKDLDDGNEDGFWHTIFKYTDALSKMGLFKGQKKGTKQKEKTQDVFDAATGKMAKAFPELYRAGLQWPKIEIGAQAFLESKDGEAYVNRNRDVPKEDPNKDSEEPYLEDGTVNKADCAKSIANRAEYECEMPEEPVQEYAYLRFNPLFGGFFSFNLIAGIERIPKIGWVVLGLDALLDFDLFQEFGDSSLKYDAESKREDRLSEEATKKFSAKGFFFATADFDFSPALYFYDAPRNQLGAGLDIRGSFGLGIAVGAFIGVNVYGFQLDAQMQGTFGVRVFFSIDIDRGTARFWHSGIGGSAEASITGGVGTDEDETGGGKGELDIGGVNYSVTGSNVGFSGTDKISSDEMYWIPPSSYDQPSYLYEFGQEVKDEVEEIEAGEYLIKLRACVDETYRASIDGEDIEYLIKNGRVNYKGYPHEAGLLQRAIDIFQPVVVNYSDFIGDQDKKLTEIDKRNLALVGVQGAMDYNEKLYREKTGALPRGFMGMPHDDEGIYRKIFDANYNCFNRIKWDLERG